MNAQEAIVRRLTKARLSAWRVVQTASTSQKLAVAFALFLIPLAFVAGKLADEQQNSVDVVLQERDGGAYLRVINEAHTLLNMQTRAQQLGHNDIDNISAAIRALRSAERRYGAGLGTADISDRAITAMRTVLNSDRARGTAAGAAVMALCDLAHLVGERAHLVRDPERASHFAAGIVIERVPMLAHQARDLATLTESVFADRRIGEGERMLVLQELALLERTSNALSNSISATTESAGSRALSSTLEPPLYAVLTNFAVYRTLIERALDRGRLNLEDLVATEAGAQFMLSDLSGRVSTSLDSMLETRATRLANERTGTLLLAAALFVVVLGFVVALLRVGLVQPIDSLSASIRAIADGSYDTEIPALARGDEIGDMARALVVLRDAAE
ncbi:MAG: HAMP domain-containing protein, partial [Phycisphaerales bacterium]|nr:HAMP domain-containing protein [Hyphomonadaceae bacterium]